MTNKQEDWPRLAELIADRMASRGWTQQYVQDQGGPAPTKLRDVLKGRSTVLKASTRRALERALEWEPRSIDTVLAGGLPVARMTLEDLRRAPGPLTAEQAEGEERLEAAFRESRERAESKAKASDTSRSARVLEAMATPPEERTPDQWDMIHAANDRRDRAAAAARRMTAEEPLVDLVDNGQSLASSKNDDDVDAYVRQVESYVVGVMGIDRLTAALDWRLQERTTARAAKAGIVTEFFDEVARLRASGIDGRALLAPMNEFVDARTPAQGLTSNDVGDLTPTVDDRPPTGDQHDYDLARRTGDSEGVAMEKAQREEGEAPDPPAPEDQDYEQREAGGDENQDDEA